MQHHKLFFTTATILLFYYVSSADINRIRIIFEHCELSQFNSSLGGNQQIAFRKVNRSAFGLTIDFDLYQDMDVNDMRLTGQLYKYVSNDYKLYPIQHTVSICWLSRRNFLVDWTEVPKYTNVPLCGPMKAGHYYVRDYVINLIVPGIPIPKVLHFGRYKIHGVIHLVDGTMLYEGECFGRVTNTV